MHKILAHEVDELIGLCRFAGADLLVTQGAGGNASVKSRDGSTIWIKASGHRMRDVSIGRGWIEMRVPDTRILARAVEGLGHGDANAGTTKCMQSLMAGSDVAHGRPSMETWFHLVLDRAVLHTHPVYANAFTCMEGGSEELAGLLDGPVACIDYRAPGHLLGIAVEWSARADRERQGTAARQWILANHGIIASAPAVCGAIALTEEILQICLACFGPLTHEELSRCAPRPELLQWIEELSEKLAESGARRHVRPASYAILNDCAGAELGPLVPDDVILNGREVLNLSTANEAADRIRSRSTAVIQVKDLGIVFTGPTEETTGAMEEQLMANALVRRLIARKGRVRPLPPREIDVLLSMESEKYRQQVLAGAHPAPVANALQESTCR